MAVNSRQSDLHRFYEILATLEHKTKSTRTLADCSKLSGWPSQGVYFFQEPCEYRFATEEGLRIVRVGTHALKAGSRRKLWDRLKQHKGANRPSGGNHRGSIFRLLVGNSLMKRDRVSCPSWEQGKSKPRSGTERETEEALERKVSTVIGAMPFLWLAVEDEPGPASMRGYIERNAIALLSNYDKSSLNPPSFGWLGSWCNRTKVQKSGLWNNNHVDEPYCPKFLENLEYFVNEMRE